MSILIPALVSAQAQPAQLVINLLSIEEQPGKQDLNLYFTVLDTQQKVVPDPKITPSTLTLDINGQKLDPQGFKVDTPTTPLYVVFLLDTSGANFASSAAMLTGVKKAMQSIEQSSKNTTFAIVQFADQMTTLTSGFTNSASASTAVDRIKQFTGSNCLFNAAYDAQNLFRTLSPTVRRALVVVTGGKDADKFNANKACSQNNTAQTVIKQAQTLPFIVPIYTVGLRRPNYPRFDDALVQTLGNISQQSGGTVNIGAPDKAEALFQSVADAFANQRVLQTSMCIAQNPANKAVLSMSVNGAPLTSAPVTFSTTTNCSVTGPTWTPAPFSITLSPGTYTLDKEEFSFRITRQGEADVAKYHIFSKYKATNTQLPGEAGDFFIGAEASQQGVTTVTFSTKDARPESFIVTVEAIGKDGARIGDAVVQEFGFERPTPTPSPTVAPTPSPVPPMVELLGISLDSTTNEIVWNLRTSNIDPVTGYTIRVLGKNNVVVYEKTFNIKPSSEIRIPAGSVPTGEYTFVVELAVPSMPNPPSFSLPVTYTAPPPPPKPIWEQIGFPLLCALVVIVAILIFGAIWLILARRPRGPRLPKAPPPPQQTGAPKREQQSGGETMAQSMRGPAAMLEVDRSPNMQSGHRVEITTTPFWLGREIDSNDGLIIPDNGISRRHAFITFENGEYYINGSKTLNGTQVNDEPLGTYDSEGWKGGKRSISTIYRSTGQPVRIALGSATVVKFSLKDEPPRSSGGGTMPQQIMKGSPPSEDRTVVLPKTQQGGPIEPSIPKPRPQQQVEAVATKDTDHARPMPVAKPVTSTPPPDQTYELPRAKTQANAPTAAKPSSPAQSGEAEELPAKVSAELKLVSVYDDALNQKLDLPIQYSIQSGTFMIGSEGGKNDTRIPSPEVSREHLLLTWLDGKFHLKPIARENLTKVNGTLLRAGEELVLQPKTEYTIQLGSKTMLSFSYTDGRMSTATMYSDRDDL